MGVLLIESTWISLGDHDVPGLVEIQNYWRGTRPFVGWIHLGSTLTRKSSNPTQPNQAHSTQTSNPPSRSSDIEHTGQGPKLNSLTASQHPSSTKETPHKARSKVTCQRILLLVEASNMGSHSQVCSCSEWSAISLASKSGTAK